MIQVQTGGYTKDDIKTLIRVLTTSEAGYYCMADCFGEMCASKPRNCKYYKVCRDITSAVNYLHSKLNES